MLSELEILEKLKSILIGMDNRNRDKVDTVNYGTKLVTDLGLSSVGMLYMVIAIEETFGIEFDNGKPFETVGEVISYIKDKIR